jgi:glycine amidinotransferase
MALLKNCNVVNSYDEWSQLEEVIVGTNTGFNGFHLDSTFIYFFWDNIKQYLKDSNYFKIENNMFDRPIIKIEEEILYELEEDLDEFTKALELLGVVVRRPNVILDSNQNIATPFWNSNLMPPLNIRDNSIILGNTIVETAPHIRSRIYENDFIKHLYNEYFSQGANWICMPHPTLSLPIEPNFLESNLTKDEREIFRDDKNSKRTNLANEIIFDGAQCIRLGKDVLVNVSCKSHELAFTWLVKCFSDKFNFHKLENISDSHLDSILLPLKPGLWLLRSTEYLKFLPKKFRNWDYIIPPGFEIDNASDYYKKLNLASRYIDMNILSVNENTLIINSLYPKLMELMYQKGFSVIPVRHRHGRMFGGGFHCVTLDIRRTGTLKSYV